MPEPLCAHRDRVGPGVRCRLCRGPAGSRARQSSPSRPLPAPWPQWSLCRPRRRRRWSRSRTTKLRRKLRGDQGDPGRPARPLGAIRSASRSARPDPRSERSDRDPHRRGGQGRRTCASATQGCKANIEMHLHRPAAVRDGRGLQAPRGAGVGLLASPLWLPAEDGRAPNSGLAHHRYARRLPGRPGHMGRQVSAEIIDDPENHPPAGLRRSTTRSASACRECSRTCSWWSTTSSWVTTASASSPTTWPWSPWPIPIRWKAAR